MFQVTPQIQCIAVDKSSRTQQLGRQIGNAFNDAVVNPRWNAGGALVPESLDAGSPEGGIVLIPYFAAVGAISAAERGLSFVDNLRDVEMPVSGSTLAGAQIWNAAKQANMREMFAEFLPVSESGDVMVIVRRAELGKKWGGSELRLKVELTRTGADSRQRVLRTYTHKAPYCAVHPDLVAKSQAPTLAIRKGIAEIAAEISEDFKLRSWSTLASTRQ